MITQSTIVETESHRQNDPKRQRVRSQPVPYMCPVCQGRRVFGDDRHKYDCPNATMDDVRRECERAVKHEKWAREKAETWLMECRRLHASLMAAKHELNALRKKASSPVK